MHIFSQEGQTRGEPRRLVRRVPYSAIPVWLQTARRGSVYELILKEAGWLTAIGIVAGLVSSLAATTPMRTLLFEVRSWDVQTLSAVATILVICSLLASFLPARRAAAVNPTEGSSQPFAETSNKHLPINLPHNPTRRRSSQGGQTSLRKVR